MSKSETEFEWTWNDPSHLTAHLKDFTTPPSKLLELIYPVVLELKPEKSRLQNAFRHNEEIWLKRSFELSESVGKSGLRDVCKSKVPSFWGYRTGRSIPSHLCFGSKELTNRLCLWGRWEPGKFIIHTMYPGTVAPREIHDPELSLEELQVAIDFWNCFAIVVNKNEFTL